MKSDDVCSAVALGVLMSWLLLLLLLCTSHTHIHRDYWHTGERLERGCRCTAAAGLLYTAFVAARLSVCF